MMDGHPRNLGIPQCLGYDQRGHRETGDEIVAQPATLVPASPLHERKHTLQSAWCRFSLLAASHDDPGNARTLGRMPANARDVVSEPLVCDITAPLGPLTEALHSAWCNGSTDPNITRIG